MESTFVTFQSYGYGPHSFIGPDDLMTIISLSRILIGFLAMPVLQKFRKRPLYLGVCVYLLLIISGIITFTHIIEKGYLTKEQIQESIG